MDTGKCVQREDQTEEGSISTAPEEDEGARTTQTPERETIVTRAAKAP